MRRSTISVSTWSEPIPGREAILIAQINEKMNDIRAICWSNVPADLAPGWVQPTGRLVAVWPSPIGADACFQRAGFSEFIDFDETTWDDEWKLIVRRMLDSLGRYGWARLQYQRDVYRPRGRSWLRSLVPWFDPKEAIDLPIAERVLLSTQDDRFAEAVVQFGEPSKVTLRTSFGHPLFWIAAAAELGLSGEALAHEISEGRPVFRHELGWQHMLGVSSH
jgi:hypothetical protein